MDLSPSPPKPLKHRLEWNRFATVTLGDGLEEHSFGFLVSLEGFVALGQEDCNCRSLREFGIDEFDVPINHTTRGYSHDHEFYLIPTNGAV